MNEWKRIPRKLRAAMVQIYNHGKVTMTEDTKKELIRRDWIQWQTPVETKRDWAGRVTVVGKVEGWILSSKGNEVYHP